MGEEFRGIIYSVVCTSEAVEKIIMAVFPGIKKKKNQNWLIGSSGLVIKLLSAFF